MRPTPRHPRILPVRVNFDGPLPYPLNAYLDSIQYATWNAAGGHAARCCRSCSRRWRARPAAVTARRSGRGRRRRRPAAAVRGAAAGARRHARRRRSLVSAAADRRDRALPLAAQPGQTLTIKGPRQMGKSSLLMRTVKAGLDAGKNVALLDFQLVDDATKADADAVLPAFRVVNRRAARAARQRRQDVGRGLLESAELHALRRARDPAAARTAPCMLAIDETDSIFRTSFSEDFFAMLRSWHGLRAHPTRRKAGRTLDIILSTSTEPQFFIDRPHESPFNVGVVLPLEDF